jgi:hypothetical protein
MHIFAFPEPLGHVREGVIFLIRWAGGLLSTNG